MPEQMLVGMRIAGGILVGLAVLRFMWIGKEDHDRSGNAPLTPTFSALDPDLMPKADRAIKLGLAGGILLLLSYFV